MIFSKEITDSFRFKYFKKLVLTFFYSLVILISVGTFSSFAQNNLNDITMIKSAKNGQCLTSTNLNFVTTYNCSKSINQNFLPTLGQIVSGKQCLNYQNNRFVLSKCTDQPSEIFLLTGERFLNPVTNQCLSIDKSNLALSSCSLDVSNTFNVLYFNNNKSVSYTPFNCINYISTSEKLSCNVLKEWNNWNMPYSNHYTLLSSYTDGNAYEEWCADFVSYIYQQSGVPFINGERNGWDEYNANNVQNENLTYHSADSNYTPKSGDVAFFNYPGGHVEMVAIGGKTPTFIYGDSATIDSQTGNGDMAANTKKSVGSLGNVMYYLSIN